MWCHRAWAREIQFRMVPTASGCVWRLDPGMSEAPAGLFVFIYVLAL